MSRPPIQYTKLNDNLELCERHPDSECRTNNWWIYDKRRGMNLAMRAKSKDEAFVEVIEYWAKCSLGYEHAYHVLNTDVNCFIDKIRPQTSEDDL